MLQIDMFHVFIYHCQRVLDFCFRQLISGTDFLSRFSGTFMIFCQEVKIAR